jgi:hypothetical protein
LEALDPIFDAPTIELLNDFLPKKRAQVNWAKDLLHEAVKDKDILFSVEKWRKYVRQYMQHLGGIDEREESTCELPVSPIKEAYGSAPVKRSKPSWLKVIDTFEPPAEVGDNLKIFMWHYMTEIQVVDPMCYIFFGLDDMPFEFYCDFARHIWDETRHHRIGMRRLRKWAFIRANSQFLMERTRFRSWRAITRN